MGLVLSVKPNEKIKIGDNLFVSVSDVKGRQVKLHFEGDKTIPINRMEKDLPNDKRRNS